MTEMLQVKGKQLATYPRRLAAWLRVGGLGVITFVMNITALVYAYCLSGSDHEDWVRGIGAALQCVGVISVVVGILMTRSQFGLPSLQGAVLNWFRGFPAVFPKTQYVSMDAVLGSATAHGMGTVRQGLKPGATTDEKIAYLLSEVERQHADISSFKKDTWRQHESLRGLIEAEEAKRTSEIRDVRKLLTAHATGGLDLSFCGAIFLLVGVMLGTLPYAWF